MPDTATPGLTASAAETRAAGSRILGFILGGGGAIVDKLHDVANFLTKNGDTFEGLRATDGDVLDIGKTGGQRLRVFASNDALGLFNTAGAGAGRDGLLIRDGGVSVDINASEIARFTSYGLGVGVPYWDSAIGLMVSKGTDTRIGLTDGTTAWSFAAGWAGAGTISFLQEGIGSRLTVTNAGVVRPGGDNSQTLGDPSYRWGNSFFGASPTITCDVRFKTYRADCQLREAEHAAALALFDAFGFCQFNDAIALKGVDGARPHFVPGAQELYSIWADHGLCDPLIENDKGELVPTPGAVPPAFICFDVIEEERAPVTEGWRPSAVLGPGGQPVMVKCAEGEEATEQRPTGETIVTREAGHIFGVRIDQLHSLMIAALNTESKALAARIAALEAAA